MELKPEWRGTGQHRAAGDLSRWLIHLTRSEEDLISILMNGTIEARAAFGAGRDYSVVQNRHRSVCLTETPLEELGRMTGRRPWGIVFDKEKLRARLNAQPVWYLADPSPQWGALRDAMDAARRDPDSPIWRLTPFIEGVRNRTSDYPNDWRWEREWRVPGHLDFELSDVAMIIADEEGKTTILDEVSVGLPWVSPDGDPPQWYDGFTRNWDASIDRMLDRFRETYTSIENSGMPWDSEDKDYVRLVEFWETEEAVFDVFGALIPELHDAIVSLLNDESCEWCPNYDLEHWGD